jgi:RecA-family ATPase
MSTDVSSNLVRIYFDRAGVEMIATKIRTTEDTTKAELKILHQDKLIIWEQFNLMSGQTKSRLVKDLNAYLPIGTQEWSVMLNEFIRTVLRTNTQGEPALFLSAAECKAQSIDYLIHPIAPMQQPTIIFGAGGSGKSYLMLLLGLLIQTPAGDNLGFDIAGGKQVLYLDWETESNVIHHRMKMLSNGLGYNTMLTYRRCNKPLAQDLEAIQDIVNKNDVEVVIVDSLAQACGGDLMHEVALEFFQGLRSLTHKGNPLSSLVVAHTSKGSDPKSNTRTVFGSAFFMNYARSVWELTGVQEAGEPKLSIVLRHKKSNYGLAKSLLMDVTFAPDKVTITGGRTYDKGYVVDQLKLSEKVQEALLHGDQTIEQIADRLKTVGHKQITDTLSKLANAGRVIRIDRGRYGIPTQREMEE